MCSSVLSLAQAMDVSIRSLEEEEGKKDADGLGSYVGLPKILPRGFANFLDFTGLIFCCLIIFGEGSKEGQLCN